MWVISEIWSILKVRYDVIWLQNDVILGDPRDFINSYSPVYVRSGQLILKPTRCTKETLQTRYFLKNEPGGTLSDAISGGDVKYRPCSLGSG